MNATSSPLKAPFPWFGGKSKVSDIVWDRFGNVPNYVEPFFGSGAVLLLRPHEPKNETINDKDAYLANFWRSVKEDPEEVAYWADWPVSEPDLHARHRWLVDQVEFRERMLTDPDFYSAKIAGWWVWGISQWIGSGWCSRPDWAGRGNGSRAQRGIHSLEMAEKRPLLGKGGHGVHRKLPRQDNVGINTEVWQQIPDISASGRGVHRKLPHISSEGQGINSQQIPHLSSEGQGINAIDRQSNLHFLFEALHNRLRRVRVCCGNWDRILGPSPTTKIGLTGVFLDPPYNLDVIAGNQSKEGGSYGKAIYNHHENDVSHAVAECAIKNGDNPDLRIALCGYEGEHEFPPSWECVYWKANGGYANQRTEKQTAGQANAHRERIWFSPHCLKTPSLFD